MRTELFKKSDHKMHLKSRRHKAKLEGNVPSYILLQHLPPTLSKAPKPNLHRYAGFFGSATATMLCGITTGFNASAFSSQSSKNLYPTTMESSKPNEAVFNFAMTRESVAWMVSCYQQKPAAKLADEDTFECVDYPEDILQTVLSCSISAFYKPKMMASTLASSIDAVPQADQAGTVKWLILPYSLFDLLVQ